ncbi:conserved hypothetical protein [Vibrio phage 249E41-1]|nr:conserved hypothetical protein [Vibrio phage 249E41-1]CAH9017280.1 conserved hypothetical protein [Vibrio phage 193E37-1]
MTDYVQHKLRKGSVITESQYGVTLESEIISEIKILHQDKPRTNQQEFKAKVISINGIPKEEGNIIDYLVGGTYGANIKVVKY